VSESLSRQLARWVAGLRFEDLPAEVVDRAKGVTLQGLASALLGYGLPDGQTALRLMQAEEPGGAGPATVLVDGTRMTRAGAAFVNAEMILAGGKWDTFRMLTHPGSAILPAGLAMAESVDASGGEYLVAIAAGYEVMERLATDFIPSVMARGFHPGPVFGIFGAAVAASKLLGLSADQVHGAIAQCVNLAAGNVEGARSGGKSVREGAAVRNALLAVALAQHGAPGGETVLEGEAGLYHAYAGNNLGKLSYSFTGATSASLDAIVAGLGERWTFLETLYRIYSTAGYNIAPVAVTAALCEEHDIQASDVSHVEAVVNWLETQYPSPAFPSPDRVGISTGSQHYFFAYGVVFRGYPLLHSGEHPPVVLEMMRRVSLVPSHAQPLFAPRVTVYLGDGRSYSREASGTEFIWDFAEEARRIREITPGVPMAPSQFEELIAACGRLENLPHASEVVRLTLRER
jgi:2-methylcitrate dehydratase PrpD